MNDPDLKQIFNLIQTKRGYKPSFRWKLLHAPEDITEDDLIVNDNLYLDRTSVRWLPDNLKVGENLILYFTQISSLLDSLSIGEFIMVDDNVVDQFHEMYPRYVIVGWRR